MGLALDPGSRMTLSPDIRPPAMMTLGSRCSRSQTSLGTAKVTSLAAFRGSMMVAV